MSRWRLVAGWSFVGALALALAGVLFFESRDVDPQALVGSAMGEGASQPAPATGSPTAAEPARPTPVPQTSPAEVGPAGGDFAALSPSAALTHPDTDPEIAKWYGWFGYYKVGEFETPSGDWTNKTVLWDNLAPGIQEEARSLGPPNTTPEWDNVTPIAAGVNVRWSDEDTKGRGELVEFIASYTDRNRGAVERYWPVLIQTLPDGSGKIAARMEPFELIAAEYAGFAEQREASANLEWRWVFAQEPVR